MNQFQTMQGLHSWKKNSRKKKKKFVLSEKILLINPHKITKNDN